MAAAVVVVVAKEMANTKQTVEAEAKTQQSTIKKQKIGSDDGRSGVAAVCGGRKCGDGCGGGHGNGRGQQGGGAEEETAATVVAECSRHHPKIL